MNKTCPNHPERKVYSKQLCRSCYEKQLISNNSEFKNRQLENSRRWASLNSEKKKEYDKNRRLKVGPQTKERFSRYLKKKFNITLEQYNKLVLDSGNKCEICGRPPSKDKKLHLDHCHTTNNIRGLLCAQCNWYLGFIDKDPSIVNKIIKYRKQWKKL